MILIINYSLISVQLYRKGNVTISMYVQQLVGHFIRQKDNEDEPCHEIPSFHQPK